MVEACGGGILATSGVEEDAMRLLGAFYDLSGEANRAGADRRT